MNIIYTNNYNKIFFVFFIIFSILLNLTSTYNNNNKIIQRYVRSSLAIKSKHSLPLCHKKYNEHKNIKNISYSDVDENLINSICFKYCIKKIKELINTRNKKIKSVCIKVCKISRRLKLNNNYHFDNIIKSIIFKNNTQT